MKTSKHPYTTPETELFRYEPEVNFCESNATVDMDSTIFDELDALDFIW